MPSLLYIEDDAGVQAALGRFFKINFPHVVVSVADNAEKAVSLLKGIMFDAVLSDYNLKAGTGGDVLNWIKTHQPDLESRFVFLSDDKACESHPYYLQKPANNRDIQKTLSQIFARGSR